MLFGGLSLRYRLATDLGAQIDAIETIQEVQMTDKTARAKEEVVNKDIKEQLRQRLEKLSTKSASIMEKFAIRSCR